MKLGRDSDGGGSWSGCEPGEQCEKGSGLTIFLVGMEASMQETNTFDKQGRFNT